MRIENDPHPASVVTVIPSFTVARYDDDYPLLYGEPARQPAGLGASDYKSAASAGASSSGPCGLGCH